MKRISIIGLLVVLSLGAMAQVRYNSGGGSSKPKENGFDPQKVVIGGGLRFGMASGQLLLGASPMVGYRVAPNFMAGVILGYQYYRVKDSRSVMNTTTGRYETYPSVDHLFSPGLWARYNLFNSFFVHAQFEYHLASSRWTEPARLAGGSGVEKVKASYTIPTLLIGAGYRLPVSDRIGIYFGLSYDVLQHSSKKTITDSRGSQWIAQSPYFGNFNPTIGLGIGF